MAQQLSCLMHELLRWVTWQDKRTCKQANVEFTAKSNTTYTTFVMRTSQQGRKIVRPGRWPEQSTEKNKRRLWGLLAAHGCRKNAISRMPCQHTIKRKQAIRAGALRAKEPGKEAVEAWGCSPGLYAKQATSDLASERSEPEIDSGEDRDEPDRSPEVQGRNCRDLDGAADRMRHKSSHGMIAICTPKGGVGEAGEAIGDGCESM
ncbi:hypothetical protein BJV74DRAFT_798200 [Russula compacta]|nr:hypothetical protein BJV74DRAFT_798200 [Russula compacta]